jgi:hypothetical protein
MIHYEVRIRDRPVAWSGNVLVNVFDPPKAHHFPISRFLCKLNWGAPGADTTSTLSSRPAFAVANAFCAAGGMKS